MSISTLAARNGQTLRKQYKEIISDYRIWNQLSHADEYILYPENFGEDISLDETCLSNGDQQLISEAIDQLGIRHRWEVLDAENKSIKEHRQKRKEAKSKEEHELIGQWEPERMENGETMPQIMARSRNIILKHKSKWNDQQKTRAEILFRMFLDLEKAYGLFLKVVDIFNKKTSAGAARLKLARWYNEVEAFGNNEFNKVLETFENHSITIINYFERRLTNTSAESFNAKIKAFRTQFRGVGDIKFFMFRLASLYS